LKGLAVCNFVGVPWTRPLPISDCLSADLAAEGVFIDPGDLVSDGRQDMSVVVQYGSR
jgi:hypothetical protein